MIKNNSTAPAPPRHHTDLEAEVRVQTRLAYDKTQSNICNGGERSSSALGLIVDEDGFVS